MESEEKQNKKIFKEIFRDHWNGFKELNPCFDTDQYEEPVQKMLGCGEESNGYSEYICMHCGKDRRRVPFSCKSCFCLSCAKKYVDDFVSQVSNMLHSGVIYRHVVLTIPKQFRIFFFKERHTKDLLSTFMKCGYECLEDVINTVKRKLSLKIGCIVVVQTHGRSGHYNPHLHIIMTSGGVDIENEAWVDLGYFNYTLIHKKWQYYLFNMLRSYFGTKEVNNLIDELWKKYPNGLVANVSKGNVPESLKGLSVYLAKYVASPPISVRRILDYDGQTVLYWYIDHETKSKKSERVNVFTFIGRMVQHIFPKWFQRVRYYGVEATKTFNKWANVIRRGVKRLRRLIKGTYQIVAKKNYRRRYQEINGSDPMKCKYCGHEMELLNIWHPKYGYLFDEYENIKAGKYEQETERGDRYTVRPTPGPIQLSLFPV